MAADYRVIDRLTLAAIANGVNSFAGLRSLKELMVEAGRIANQDNADRKNGYSEVEDWRVLDRRLQALRKMGLIQFSRKCGWAVPGEVQS